MRHTLSLFFNPLLTNLFHLCPQSFKMLIADVGRDQIADVNSDFPEG